ncbi:MAG: WD40 repeat domain-containing protein [Patescibacteria group bacterium]
MNKKLLTTFIIIILLTAALAAWYFFQNHSNDGQKESNSDSGRFFSGLFPDIGPSGREEEKPGSGVSTTTPPAAATAKLYKLVPESVSGAMFVKNAPQSSRRAATSSSAGKIRYIERATGHVYDIDPDGKNKTRISNTTAPGIFDVAWAPDGNRAVLKYAAGSSISIISAKFTGSTTQGVFLSSDLKDILFSPKGDRIAYVAESGGDGVIITASPENKNPRVIFKNPFSSWMFLWPEEGIMYIAPRPSAYLNGFLYRLNIASGALEKIAGPRAGLLFSVSGNTVLVSESNPRKKTIDTLVLDAKTGKTSLSPVRVIPEKCAWSKKEKEAAFCAVSDPFPPAVIPDDWYQGKILFADKVVKINFGAAPQKEFMLGEFADVYKPFLSPEEDKLFFINRVDGALWALELSEG